MQRFVVAACSHEFEPVPVRDQSVGHGEWLQKTGVARSFIVEVEVVPFVPNLGEAAVEVVPRNGSDGRLLERRWLVVRRPCWVDRQDMFDVH